MYIRYQLEDDFKFDEDKQIYVRDIHIASYDESWHSTVHTHTFTELFYCVGGQGEVWTEKGSVEVSKNSLVIVNPYVKHTEYSSKKNHLSYVVLGLVGIVASKEGQLQPYYHFKDTHEIYRPYIDGIVDEVKKDSKQSSAVIHHLVNAMMLQLNSNTHAFKHTNVQDSTLSTHVYNAKIYIDTHFSSNITLDLLSEKVHLSKYHLSHRFKSEMGVTIMKYLDKVRFDRATEMLENSSYTINQIASLTGFNSSAYFSTKFRGEFGVTPSEYRKKTSK